MVPVGDSEKGRALLMQRFQNVYAAFNNTGYHFSPALIEGINFRSIEWVVWCDQFDSISK